MAISVRTARPESKISDKPSSIRLYNNLCRKVHTALSHVKTIKPDFNAELDFSELQENDTWVKCQNKWSQLSSFMQKLVDAKKTHVKTGQK